MKQIQDNEKKIWPAIINARCPRCRVGKIFANRTYSLKGQGINKKCSYCGLQFEKEPGFFYSAMYVSYAFTVAELVISGTLIAIFSRSENPWLYITLMLSTVALLAPFNFRYSRILLLYWLTPGLKYQPQLNKTDK